MAYTGVDLHKNFCLTLLCTHDGEVLKEGRIPTEKEDIEEFCSGQKRLEIALDVSTNYEYYYDLLERFGHQVVVAHPLKTRTIADAKTLAELLCGDLFRDRRRIAVPHGGSRLLLRGDSPAGPPVGK